MFKSYTRKSSAIVGAERAGLSAKAVCQVNGVWGFYPEQPKQTAVIEARPVDKTVIYLMHDRRKSKRAAYQMLKALRKSVQPGAPEINAAVKVLRNCLRLLRSNRNSVELRRYKAPFFA